MKCAKQNVSKSIPAFLYKRKEYFPSLLKGVGGFQIAQRGRGNFILLPALCPPSIVAEGRR